MRILKLVSRFPYPPNSGAQLRDYNLLRRLGREHDLALFSFADRLPSPEERSQVEAFCRHVFVTVGGAKTVWAGLRNLFEPVPYHVTSFRSRAMCAALGEYLRQHPVDVIDANDLHLTQYLLSDTAALRVRDQHDLDRMAWERFAKFHGNPLVRAFCRLNLGKVKRYEVDLYKRLDLVFCVSEDDLDMTRALAPDRVRLHLAPNGVDTTEFAPVSEPKEQDNVLVICGGMSQPSTVDAVLFFVSELWPNIRRVRPDVELWLVGRSPTSAIQRLHLQSGIRVTGTVADVRPYLAQAAVVLAPYRMGSGTKLKVLNALSMGKAIVATPVGAQGLDLDPLAIRIADSNGEYVAEVLRLLEDPRARRRMGELARQEAERKYDWDRIANAYATALAEGVAAKRARPADWAN